MSELTDRIENIATQYPELKPYLSKIDYKKRKEAINRVVDILEVYMEGLKHSEKMNYHTIIISMLILDLKELL